MSRLSIVIICLAALILQAVPAIVAEQASTSTDSMIIAQSSEITHADSDCAYIGNSNTHKFHRPGCSWVPKIKPEHVVCFSSASQAMSAGYDPCKKCNPM